MKVLIIAGSFPPNSDVGGVRPSSFFQYFNEAGIDTHVFTIQHETNNTLMDIKFSPKLLPKIHRMSYSNEQENKYLENRGIRKMLRDFFNPSYSSPPGLLDEASSKIFELLDLKFFDLVIASVPNMWTAVLANSINIRYGIKYIIDFRDASEQEKGMPRSFRQKIQVIRSNFERKKIARNSSELITVSKYLSDRLEKKLNKKTNLIYNGFDENLFNANVENKNEVKRKVIKIVYIGKLINTWYRNPAPLLMAINQINKNQNKKIEIHFYGTENNIIEKINNYSWVYFNNRIPFNEVNDILNSADLLLVLTNNDRKGILTTKLFEYMPINKPIICLPNNDEELKDIITDYGLGFSLSNKEEIMAFFKNYDENLKAFQAMLPLRNKINFFTRENQSKLLIDFLKKHHQSGNNKE
jgi:hypothetical protein